MAGISNVTEIFHGNTTEVDTVLGHPLGTRARDLAGNEYIYMAGCASTILGSWVTYDELYATTLLAGTSVGPVAVAMAAIDATIGAADVAVGYETTAGHVGDGHGAGDQIYGAVARDAISANTTGTFQINYPFVDDDSN